MSFTRPNTKNGLRTIQSNSDGFTLVELLVAITIFSLIIGMAMFSLRHSFIIVRQLDAPFAEETQRLSRMRDCISSLFNYVTPSRDMFNNSKGFSTFFSGEPESMTFVSKTPPSGRTMAICRLSLVKGAVVLEEAPLYDGTADYLSPSLDNREKKSTVVVAGATSLRLEYLRNGKKTTTLKAALPSQILIVIAADGKDLEYYCRIPTNFDEKVSLTRVINDPF